MMLVVRPDACWQRPFLGTIVGPDSAYFDLEIIFYWIVLKDELMAVDPHRVLSLGGRYGLDLMVDGARAVGPLLLRSPTPVHTVMLERALC
jgi:hypothetical protein